MNYTGGFPARDGKWVENVGWLFLANGGKLSRMDNEADAAAKREHGRQLKAAMASTGVDRETVADAVGRDVKTVTNWRGGSTMPDGKDRAILRRLFPSYDEPGDAVERAVRASGLIPWRQDAVLSFYKRNLYEQAADAAG